MDKDDVWTKYYCFCNSQIFISKFAKIENIHYLKNKYLYDNKACI